MRPNLIIHALLPVVILVAASCAPQQSTPAGDVILISIDTLRSDRLPAYGYQQIETPAIDRLRSDAMLFSRAYTSCPLTLPAHVSLLTGMQPPRHGVRDNVGYRFDSQRVSSLGSRLADRGYVTGAFVSSFVLRGATGLEDIFDHYDDRFQAVERRTIGEIERAGVETVDAALAWLDQQTQPVFGFVHLFEPHAPYAPPPEIAAEYGESYDGEVVAADRVVGRLLESLRQRERYDSSLIVLVSDHGEGLNEHGEREHGLLLYRTTVQIPLLLKLPGSRRAGETVTEPVHIVDVAPTILEVAGAEPDGLDGFSLLDPPDPDRLLYSETLYPRLHFGWAELRAVMQGRHRYVSEPNPELFDVVADPAEMDNRIARERPLSTRLRLALDRLTDEAAAPQQSEDTETRRKLQALGYLTTTGATADSTVDPRLHVAALTRLEQAVQAGGRGEHEQAVATLSELVTEYPGMLDARFQLGTALRALGRDDEALTQFQAALENAPVPIPGVLIEIGRIHLDHNQLDQAEAHAELAVEALPVEASDLLTRVALSRGQPDAALARARQSVEAEDPPRPEQLLLLARVHSTRSEFQQALTVLDRLERRMAERGDESWPWLSYERGEALARLGRNQEARAAFEEEIRLYPANVRAYEKLAYVLAVMREFDAIEPLLERMAEASPTRAGYLFVAQTAERLGDTDAAAEWRRRAAELPEGGG